MMIAKITLSIDIFALESRIGHCLIPLDPWVVEPLLPNLNPRNRIDINLNHAMFRSSNQSVCNSVIHNGHIFTQYTFRNLSISNRVQNMEKGNSL